MPVFRIEKTKDYTVMSNHHLRDTDLSLKAKGMLSLMLSLPDDWDYTLAGLEHICNPTPKGTIKHRAFFVSAHQIFCQLHHAVTEASP